MKRKVWLWNGEYDPGRRSARDSPVRRASRSRELEKTGQRCWGAALAPPREEGELTVRWVTGQDGDWIHGAVGKAAVRSASRGGGSGQHALPASGVTGALREAEAPPVVLQPWALPVW